jgi:hypothetical protein
MSETLPAIRITETDIVPLIGRSIESVRDDMRDSPYIQEALRVLPAGGYRSAIGAFWNAVVDDLRKKIMFRSLALFNKSVACGREIKTYEDFQDYVNDDQLIEGAYKIGVIGWEASRILRHAKETRHIFSGHPKSSDPSIVKVMAMMDDCIKYVLNAEYPPKIIDIDEYMTVLASPSFDRNKVAVENALGDLPEVYKNELINRLFTGYTHKDSPTDLRSNIEFIAPIMWPVLPKEVQVQVVRRVDQAITKGDVAVTEFAFAFVRVVDGTKYLSTTAKKYRIQPLVESLDKNVDVFREENRLVQELEPYAASIPSDLMNQYVSALTQTFVGRVGSSAHWSRTDFFADQAALLIPGMFQRFDDQAAASFVHSIRNNDLLKRRIHTPAKMRRLRSLGNIVLSRISASFPEKHVLEALVDEEREEEFLRTVR